MGYVFGLDVIYLKILPCIINCRISYILSLSMFYELFPISMDCASVIHSVRTISLIFLTDIGSAFRNNLLHQHNHMKQNEINHLEFYSPFREQFSGLYHCNNLFSYELLERLVKDMRSSLKNFFFSFHYTTIFS